jgi:hypothetical protein
MESIIFTGSKHQKRGQGIQKVACHNIQEIDKRYQEHDECGKKAENYLFEQFTVS